MGILFRTKFASPSECKCNSNALIFSLIGHESSELREFCEMCPEMEDFRPAPSVLQTAVNINGNFESNLQKNINLYAKY